MTAYEILGQTVVAEVMGDDFDIRQLISAGAEAANRIITETQKKPTVPGMPPPPGAGVPPAYPPPMTQPQSTNFFTQNVAGIPVWGWGGALVLVGTGIYLAMRK